MKPSSEKWRLVYEPPAERVLRAEKSKGGKDWKLICEALSIIGEDPYRGTGVKKLVGKFEGTSRVKKGDWRVIYEIDKETHTVDVLYIRGRPEAYRGR